MSKAKKSGVIPAIKKDILSFILEERGAISKQVMISLGALIASLEAMSLLSKTASAQSITAKHSHCDPAHCSGGGGGHTSYAACTSNQQVPNLQSPISGWGTHCSGGGGWGHTSYNPGHGNNIVLNYG